MNSAIAEFGASAAGAAQAQALLRVEAVAHSFGGLDVLRNVAFDVPAGSIVGLIGPNGSGKTTCFNIISGFLRPKGGKVLLAGRDITADSVQQRSRAGLVRTFQTPQVFEHMTVLENLMAGCHKATRSGVVHAMLRSPLSRRELQAMHEAALACARKFGLEGLLQHRAGALPAGQRRIVELARACIGEPSLLLLDEPSSGLNSEEIELLRAWILRLNGEGMTILLVSHDMGLMTICGSAHVLYYGEIIASGTLQAVQADPRVREAYMGV